MTRDEFTSIIDHTALKPETTKDEIRQVCEEACTFGFGAVCVAPLWIPHAKRCLGGSTVRIVTVIGFPHGNTLPDVKAYEAKLAIEAGAQELDMVISIGLLRAGNHGAVLDDIQGVVNVAHRAAPANILVKVILETSLLTREEQQRGCQLVEKAGADFVKTSTGFAGSPITIEDVGFLRRMVGERVGVKAAGGIRDLITAVAMVNAGASRIGTSSSVAIMKMWPV
ncbi:MAG TPA: deoxyribose-phosphate aldolase [Nitrospirales bacterium]|nr:deoxyribose-phosphate aldolase [Nitrospiraceae bacterium]HNP29931.1 deoxyribose-phosphate aldolase [Nitrospirales bacterium]